MNAVLSVMTWAVIAVIAVGGFAIGLPLAILTVPFDRGRKIAGRFLRLQAVAVAKLSPFWDFRIHGQIPSAPSRKTVVVSNHESNADPFLISMLPWEMKWLGKAALFAVPFVGWSLWLAGDVPVRRGDSSSGRSALDACARWLSRGVPVMIFPEGTRSKTSELLPFKDGAFRLAIETGADVLPIAVSGTGRALPKHSWRFSKARALLAAGQPIPTEGMTLDDVPRLKAMARERIEALRARLHRLASGK